MNWLTWRRFRVEIILLAAPLALLGAWLVANGLQRYAAFNAPSIDGLSAAACVQRIQTVQENSACFQVMSFYQNIGLGGFGGLFSVSSWLWVIPPLVGAMLGAPLLARDLERGTFRLIWTQGRTRLAWARSALVAQVIAALALTGAITAIVVWWGAPDAAILGHFSSFDTEGMTPLAYTLFTLALAAAAGVILRATVPAIIAALVGYFAAHAFITGLRPIYMRGLTMTYDPSAGSPGGGPAINDWAITSTFVDRAGHPVSQDAINTICGANDPTSPGNPTSACVHAHGWLYQVTWQPDSRFWAFQGIESAIYLALAVLLMALALWWVRKRLA